MSPPFRCVQIGILSVLTALALLSFRVAHAADGARPPNIVMIISDDQAWRDYGFMGHPQIETPNMDKLAAESLTFRRGYVPASLCCPSLASIVTGLYPHQHLVTSNDPPPLPGVPRNAPAFQQAFDAGRAAMNKHLEQVPTLPRLLKDKGYVSLQTGKWWQGHYSHGGFTHGMTKGERHGDEGLQIGRKTMQPIYDFIAEAKTAKKPFLVWYAPMMPHTPHNAPVELVRKYESAAPSKFVARYWAMCEWFDQTCGELLHHIDKQELADETIVVFVADNGWIQDPTAEKYAAKSKQSPYDGGIRTPIMIRWPKHIEPRTANDLAMSIDILPTLLTAIGEQPTPAMQGINLLDAAAVESRKAITGECFTHDSRDLDKPAASLRWRWAIEGDRKLILPAPQNETGPPELYDLTTDPQETKNLATQEPATVTALSERLDAWWPGR